jgi:hypothetical protein
MKLRFLLLKKWLLGRDFSEERNILAIFACDNAQDMRVAITKLCLANHGLRIAEVGEEETNDFFLKNDQKLWKEKVAPYGFRVVRISISSR